MTDVSKKNIKGYRVELTKRFAPSYFQNLSQNAFFCIRPLLFKVLNQFAWMNTKENFRIILMQYSKLRCKLKK